MREHETVKPIDVLSQANPDSNEAEVAIKAITKACELSHETTAGLGFDPGLGDSCLDDDDGVVS